MRYDARREPQFDDDEHDELLQVIKATLTEMFRRKRTGELPDEDAAQAFFQERVALALQQRRGSGSQPD